MDQRNEYLWPIMPLVGNPRGGADRRAESGRSAAKQGAVFRPGT